MTELILARHGLAHCNVAGIVGGPRGCTGLTEEGHRQAARLAERLRVEAEQGQPVSALWSSPRRRAQETAEVAGRALGLPVEFDARLSDVDVDPGLDGHRWAEVRARLSLRADEFPGWTQYVPRVTAALRDIVDRTDPDRVLVVTHVEAVTASFAMFLGLAAAPTGFACAIDHAALTVWRRSVDGPGPHWWTLVRHNDARHLIPERM